MRDEIAIRYGTNSKILFNIRTLFQHLDSQCMSYIPFINLPVVEALRDYYESSR